VKRLILAACVVLALGAGASAQEKLTMIVNPPKPAAVEKAEPKPQVLAKASPEAEKLTTPELSDVQKLTIQNLALSLDNAQLRAQQAQWNFDVAREAIGKLVHSLQVDGWTLDLQRLEYVKKVEPKKDK